MELYRANPNTQVEGQKAGQVAALLLTGAGDRLVDIYEAVLGVEKEWLLDHVELKDEIAIMDAIMEVNDIPFLVEQVKKLTAKVKKTMPTAKVSSEKL